MRGKAEVRNLEANGLRTDIGAMGFKEMTSWKSQGSRGHISDISERDFAGM